MTRKETEYKVTLERHHHLMAFSQQLFSTVSPRHVVKCLLRTAAARELGLFVYLLQ